MEAKQLEMEKNKEKSTFDPVVNDMFMKLQDKQCVPINDDGEIISENDEWMITLLDEDDNDDKLEGDNLSSTESNENAKQILNMKCYSLHSLVNSNDSIIAVGKKRSYN